MSHFKKKAWGDFTRMCITIILLLLGFGLIILLNIKGGIKHLLPALVSSGFIVAIGLFAKLRAKEKDVQSYLQFDEREFYLLRKSQDWSNYFFLAFMSIAMMALFSLVGSRGMIPAWSMPLTLFSAIFLSETVRFMILMHYAKEDDKNVKGGPV